MNNTRTAPVGATAIPGGRAPGYGLVDARIGVKAKGGVEFQMGSRNLTNKNYVDVYTREFLGTLIETRAEPHTWGGEARVKF